MRILHIIGTMDPASGGPAEVIRMLIEFAPEDVSYEVATCDPEDAGFLADLGCPAHGLGRGGPGYSYAPKLLPWMRKNRTRFDAAVVHGLWTYPTLAAWRAFRGRLPYAVFVHGMLDPYFNRISRAKQAKKLPYWMAVERQVLRDARRVVFTTLAEQELAQQSFPFSQWNAAVFPLGTRPPGPVFAEEFWRVCPEVRERRYLLFLGRIDEKKGCDLLLEAFGRLHDAGLHLVMAGPDAAGWRSELETILASHGAAERVHWPGMLTGHAKNAALAMCEAFVLPSHQENFGIAVTEALSHGRPVLISDKVNIAEEVEAEGCGVVESDTLDGTLRLLQRWNELGPAQRDAMSTRASSAFAGRYNMQHNATAFAGLFGEAL